MTGVPKPQMSRTNSIAAPLRHLSFRRIWLASLLSNLRSLIQGVGAACAMTQMTFFGEQGRPGVDRTVAASDADLDAGSPSRICMSSSARVSERGDLPLRAREIIASIVFGVLVTLARTGSRGS
jgi:hypothetical protein